MDFKKYFKENNVNLSDKEKIAIKIGGLITAARLHSKLSQTKLAEMIGTQQPSVARAEKGDVIPSIEFLYKIAKALDTEFIFPRFGFMGDSRATAVTNFDGNGTSSQLSPVEYYRSNSVPVSVAVGQIAV
ncbi:MAG: hypothetical protein A2481_00565 [Candidatus Yonathbacteria bacterium RIFOXYC2_FULL_47_9]|nr:MAG: hypothetical protein A2481_00565 [Candidatus Yonathbacteria bacterium RIFOXYC2_FULL_47_9]HAT68129.1 hypothetical protein [Candidatus Yonathbacteria bacterium]